MSATEPTTCPKCGDPFAYCERPDCIAFQAPPTLEEQRTKRGVEMEIRLAAADAQQAAAFGNRYSADEFLPPLAEKIHALYADALASLAAERDALVEALHDAIRRPMGVVPDSAAEFYDPTRALAAAAPPKLNPVTTELADAYERATAAAPTQEVQDD